MSFYCLRHAVTSIVTLYCKKTSRRIPCPSSHSNKLIIHTNIRIVVVTKWHYWSRTILIFFFKPRINSYLFTGPLSMVWKLLSLIYTVDSIVINRCTAQCKWCWMFTHYSPCHFGAGQPHLFPRWMVAELMHMLALIDSFLICISALFLTFTDSSTVRKQ